MFKLIVLTCACALSLVSQAHGGPSPFQNKNELLESLKTQKTLNLLLTLKERPQETLNKVKSLTFKSRAERLDKVAQVLKEFAAKTQKNLQSMLLQEQVKSPQIKIKTLWISNQIIVKGVDSTLLKKLLARKEISKIEQERIFSYQQLFNPGQVQVQAVKKLVANETIENWGIATIHSPEVWAQGNRGQNVTVANIDGGVLYTHEALKNSYRADHGWYDIEIGSEFPNDNFDGHGTHTMGIILGSKYNIGVAPESKWIACRMCDTNHNCSNFGLLECGQWLTCPTNWDGSDPDCSKAPHVISNSWGFDQENNWYTDVISAWHAGGIIPVFALGNSGPECGTSHSPGDYADVIGVGSTSLGDILSTSSSKGPTEVTLRMKPDIVAPGNNVVSASWDGDEVYESRSGTSMACPHVVGLVALMLSEQPELTYNEIKQLLQSGAVPIKSNQMECNGVGDDIYPNYSAGYGRIDALNSINEMKNL